MSISTPVDIGNVVGGSSAVPSYVNGTYFYLRLSGYIVPTATGLHTIGVNCADGCNLYIGAQQLVSVLNNLDVANSLAAYTHSTTILLTAGVYYPLVIEWQHGKGIPYELQLLWTPPLGALALIPAANLTSDPASIDNLLDAVWWNGTSNLWYPGGNGSIDFANTLHPNKHLDNIPDGTTYARPLGTRINAGRPVVDFSESIHANKNVDNIADGSTYARTLASALTAGVPNLPPTMTATVGGLVPTPPNDATMFLNGQGAFTVAGGAAAPCPPLSAFSWVNQGSSTNGQEVSGGPIQVTVPDAGASLALRGMFLTPPATPYKVTACIQALTPAFASSQAVGIYFHDGTKYESLEILFQASGSVGQRVQRWTNNSTAGTTPKNQSATSANARTFQMCGVLSTAPYWIQLRNDGTSLYFDFSMDGSNWVNWYSELISAYITPTKIGFAGLSQTSGSAASVTADLLSWSVSGNATL